MCSSLKPDNILTCICTRHLNSYAIHSKLCNYSLSQRTLGSTNCILHDLFVYVVSFRGGAEFKFLLKQVSAIDFTFSKCEKTMNKDRKSVKDKMAEKIKITLTHQFALVLTCRILPIYVKALRPTKIQFLARRIG